MQQAQENYRKIALGALLVLGLLLAVKPAVSADAPTHPSPRPDILTDAPAGPCDPQSGQADLVPGTDVNGNPVAPADLASGPIPNPGQIAVPLRARRGRDPAYVTVDGNKLGPLLDPSPSCH